VLPPRLRVLVVSREVGGRAVFSCEPGFGLRGPPETVCQPNGDWATPFPSCEGLSTLAHSTIDLILRGWAGQAPESAPARFANVTTLKKLQQLSFYCQPKQHPNICFPRCGDLTCPLRLFAPFVWHHFI
jgi:hypothetical protein